MTAIEIQRIALRLANQGWCRYWLNYGDKHDDVEMAIQCLDCDGAVEIKELEEMGFKNLCANTYTIKRTNEDGTPYQSLIF